MSLVRKEEGKTVVFFAEGRSRKLVVQPDGECLVVNYDEAIQVLDARTGTERVIPKEDGQALPLAISPDIRRLATTRRVWDVIAGEPMVGMKEVSGLQETFYGIFSPDGQRMPTVGNQGVDLRDAARGHWTFTLRGFAEGPCGKLLTPDGNRNISIADTVKIFEATP